MKWNDEHQVRPVEAVARAKTRAGNLMGLMKREPEAINLSATVCWLAAGHQLPGRWLLFA